MALFTFNWINLKRTVFTSNRYTGIECEVGLYNEDDKKAIGCGGVNTDKVII